MRSLIVWLIMIVSGLLLANFLRDYWDLIDKNTGEVTGLLIAFGFFLGGITWFLLEREYRGKLNNRDGQIDRLKTELQSSQNDYSRHLSERDNRIQELSTRLGEIEPDSIYKNLSNESLKTRTLNHVQNIREFIQKTESNSDYQQRQSVNLNVLATEDRGDDEFRLYQEGQQYWVQFNNETLLLKDELKRRLPPNRNCEGCQYNLLCNMSYRDPFGIPEIRRIADDLERLASSLITNPPSDTSSQTSSS